jgi:lysozyme
VISAQTLADLRRDEGWRPSPYRDVKGYLSIGYGFLIDERKPVTLPRAVGELWLQLTAEGNWSVLLHAFPWLQMQPDDVQRALINMTFQMGATGVAGFHLMMSALERGDRETAAVNCLDSDYGREFPERAGRVATLIRGHGPGGDD